jgi:hypothetical protein
LDSQTLKAKVVVLIATRSLRALIAENEQQAREMAIDETNKKFSKSGGRAREWSIRVLESGVDGPPASSIAATARHSLWVDTTS